MAKGKKKKNKQRKSDKAVQQASLLNVPGVIPVETDAIAQTLLTIPQLCHYLSISRATLYRLELPGRLKVGSQIRFHKPTIDQWIVTQLTR